MDGLEKPELKRSVGSQTPEGLNVSIKQVSGGRLDGKYSVVDNMDNSKIAVAYDIAGNAIECNLQDILDKKLRPTPSFDIVEHAAVEKEMIWTDDHIPKRTRSGKLYDA